MTLADGTILESTDCHSEGDSVLEITKSAMFEICYPGQLCQFEYTVHNVGSGDYNGDITLLDAIAPVGGHISSIAPALCDDVSDLEGTGCTGNTSVPAGGSISYIVDYIAPSELGALDEGAFHDAENCVSLFDETMGEFDDPADIDGHQACTEFLIGDPLLEIEKVANGDCVIGAVCSYTINISTQGQPFNGSVAFIEQMGGLGGSINSTTPALPAGCVPGNPVSCVFPVSLAANSTYSLDISATITATVDDVSDSQNCVMIAMLPAGIPSGPFDAGAEPQWADQMMGIVGPVCMPFEQPDSCGPEIPNNQIDDDCDGEIDEGWSIESSKTCEPMYAGGAVATLVCEITVTGQNLVSGETITVFDQLLSQPSSPASPVGPFLASSTVTSSESWSCTDTSNAQSTGGYCELSADDLIAAGGVSVLSVVVDITNHGGAAGDLTNCTRAQSDAQAQTTDADDMCIPVPAFDCAIGEQYIDGACSPVSTPTGSTTSSKTCLPLVLAQSEENATIECTINVVGQNLQPGEIITLQDEFTQGGFSVVLNGFLDGNMTSSENWVCTDNLNGSSIEGSCALSSDDLIAAGGTSELTMVFGIVGAMEIQGPLENCITIGTTSNPIEEGQEPDVCAPIGITTCADGDVVFEGQCTAPPTLTATKTCEPAVLENGTGPNYVSNCAITVTADRPPVQPYTIRDVLMGPNGMDSSKVTEITHADNWWCGGSLPYPAARSVACEIHPNSFPSTLTSTINYALTFQPEDAQQEWKNCMATNGEEPWGCVDIIFDVVQEDDIDRGGAGSPVVPQAPILEPFKSQIEACSVNKATQTYACKFKIGVQNVGTAPYSGPMVLDDTFGTPQPQKVDQIEGDGWSCLRSNGLGTSCLNGALDLAPGSRSFVTMQLTIPGLPNGGVFENCVGVGVGNSKFLRASIAQTVMNRLGIDVGTVDGSPGPKTRQGVRQLQERLGLEQTGEIDNKLFTALGIPSTDGVDPECIQVQLPPMPASCEAGQTRNSKGVCYWPKVDCPSGQVKNSKGSCYTPRDTVKSCPSGYKRNSKGVCYKPQSGQQCNARSTVKSGDGCACRYGNMRKSSATSCVCRNTGAGPIKGLGCPKIQIRPREPDAHDGAAKRCRIVVGGICIK